MFPFPEPEVVTAHHEALLEVVHAELEATLKLVVPANTETFWFAGVTERAGRIAPVN